MSAFPPYAFSGSEIRATASRFSRRGFIGGAAAVTAALPAAPTWADAPSGAAPADAVAAARRLWRYPLLAQLKTKYDPDNLFRLNANIRPRS